MKLNYKLINTTSEIFIGCFVLGVLVQWQADNRQNIAAAQTPEAQEVVAVEVARLTNANTDLRKQLADITQREYELQQAIVDKQSASSTIGKERDAADIITGTVAVNGPGIVLVINDGLTNAQVTDVLNALKNIGAEALAINGHRVTPWFSEWRTNLSAPYTVVALGSPPVLSTSLTRRGGIIDQIELAAGALDLDVQEHDDLTLPAAALPELSHTKTIEE